MQAVPIQFSARTARYRVLLGCWLVLLFGLAAGKLWAQPVNNNIANATVITGAFGAVSGSNAGANNETQEPDPGNIGGASIWYRWIAPASGTVTITTEGSNFDTLLGVYTSAFFPPNFAFGVTQVVTNDDANAAVVFGLGNFSRTNFTAVAGTTYYVVIDGFNDGTGADIGNTMLTWQIGTPAGNNFPAATSLGAAGSSGVRLNDVNVAASFETGEPPMSLQPPLAADGGASVWFSWTAPSPGPLTQPVTFSTAGSALDTQMAVYENQNNTFAGLILQGADDNGAGNGDSRVSFIPTAGVNYRIQVDGKTNANANARPPAASEGAFNFLWGMVPGNDDLVNAYNLDSPNGLGPTAPLTPGAWPYVTNNLGGTLETGSGDETLMMPTIAGQTVNSTVWWRWTAPFSGFVRFDTIGSGFDTLLAVYTNNAAPAAPDFTTLQPAQALLDPLTPTYVPAEDDNGGGGGTSRTLPVWVDKETVYYIRVGGKAGAEGLVRLNWAPAAVSSPSGDNANGANPVPLPTDSGSMLPQSFTNPLLPSTVGATKQAGEMNHAGTNEVVAQYGGASIWYSYTPTVDGLAAFDTAGSPFNTMLAAYTRQNNTFSTYTLMAGNDDDPAAPLATTSRISFPVTAGTTYYIAVDGFYRTNLTVSAVSAALDTITTSTAHGLPTNAPVFFASTATLPAPLVAGTKYYAVPVSATQFQVSSTPDGLGIVDLTSAGTGVRTVAYADTPSPNSVAMGPVQLNWSLGPAVAAVSYPRGSAGKFRFVAGSFYATERETQNRVFENSRPYSGAPITITRGAPGGVGDWGVGRILVKYRTIEPPDPRAGTAVPNVDYIPASGTLIFNDYDMSQTFVVRPIPNALSLSDSTVTIEITEAVIDDGRAFATRPLGDLPDAVSEIQPPTLAASLATLNISDLDDGFNFERFNYHFDEGQSPIQIALWRARTGTFDPGAPQNGGSVQWRINHRTPASDRSSPGNSQYNFFPLQAGSDYAVPSTMSPNLNGTDYTVAAGTVSWGGGDFSIRTIDVTIDNDTVVEFNEDLLAELFFTASPPPTGHRLGSSSIATATIMFDDQPAGSVDRNHNVDNNNTTWDSVPPLGAYSFLTLQDNGTDPPFNTAPGANGPVFAVAVDVSQRTLLAGDFTAFNTYTRQKIARMLNNGQIDQTFDPGFGANGYVAALAIQSDGKIIAGGGFSSFNSFGRNGIARLNANGSVDTTFNPGTGLNDAVRAVALYTSGANSGKIMVGGDFTTANSTNRNFIARLNGNGVMDATFDPGSGANGPVHAIVIQPDGKVLIGGEFTAVDGLERHYLARLNADGSVDASFDPGDGADDVVFALALDSNQRIYLGGAFKSVDLRSRNSIARLNTDGSLDTAFDPQAGANGPVYAIAIQSDNKPIIAGSFSDYNTTRRMSVARLYTDGSLDTTILDTAFNQFAGMVKARAVDPQPPILALALQTDGDIIIGGAFSQAGGGYMRNDVRNRSNVARLIGGANPDTEAPGNFQFVNPSYSWGEAQGDMFILIERVNGRLGQASVTLSTSDKPPGPGVAVAGVDYTATARTATWLSVWDPGDGSPRMFTHALMGQNNDLDNWLFQPGGTFVFYGSNDANVPVLDNSILQGDRTLNLGLSLPNNVAVLGGVPTVDEGEVIPLGVALGRSSAPMTIVEDDLDHGTLGFTSTAYSVDESVGTAAITVTRTNGFAGSVTINYATANGPVNSATAGVDYTTKSGTLTFSSGQTNQTIFIPIANDTTFEPDETITINLSNPTGGAVTNNAVLPVTAVLTVLDDDFAPGRITFTQTAYVTNENAVSAVISVARTGGTLGTVSADFHAMGPTAINNVDIVNTNGTLVWPNGDGSVKTFIVPVLQDQTVDGTKTVDLTLDTFVTAIPGQYAAATLTIQDVDAFGQFSFNAGNYSANENGGTVDVTVIRTGGESGDVSVDFRTVDLTATADTGTETFTVAGGHGLTDGCQVSFTTSIGGTPPGNVTADTPYYLINSTTTTFQIATTPGGAAVDIGPSAETGTLFVVSSDYGAVPVTQLNFAPGELSKIISLTLTNNAITESNRTFLVQLSNAQGGASLAAPTSAIVTIIDDETFNEPAGSVDTTFSGTAGANDFVFALGLQADQKLMVGGAFTSMNGFRRNRIARLNANGDFDSTFVSGTGFNDTVQSIAVYTSGFHTGRIVVGGQFTTYNGTNVNHLARLNSDGSFDTTFNVGSGPDSPVSATLIQPDGRVLIGGSFSTVNGLVRSGVARLTTNGVVDSAFVTGTGANGSVFGLALQPDGKILIGGDFTTYNNVPRKGLARLNTDGSLDDTFNTGTGTDGAVRAVVRQSSGQIVIGGSFTTYNGANRNFIARLNRDGSLDGTFDTSGLKGGDASVLAISVEDDDDLVVVGGFTRFGDVTRNRITRLNADGTTDPTINFGTGANDFVNAVVVPASHRTMVIGGGFTQVDGIPRNYIARLHGGAIDGVGSVEYLASTFGTLESAGNATIAVRRRGGTKTSITVTNLTSDLTAMSPTHYIGMTNALIFLPGEAVQTFNIPIKDDSVTNADRYVFLNLKTNATDGATLGLQPFAFLIITNDDSQIGFSTATYSVSENTGVGAATITVVRTGSSIGAASMDFFSTTNGTATAGLDFTPVSGTLSFAAGESLKTFSVPISDDTLVENNETIELVLTNFNGLVTPALSAAILTIVDNDTKPGELNFSSANYITNESSVTVDAVITVVRANGSSGVVTVSYATTNGTAIGGLTPDPGIDYRITTGTLSFASGETVKTFTIPIYADTVVETNETVNLTLSSPTGGASLGALSMARLTIVNNNILVYGNLVFSSASYTNNEGDGIATIIVNRVGSAAPQDKVSVMYATSDGTGVSGAHYAGVTNVLTWEANDATPQSFAVPLFDNSFVDGDKTVNLALFNATNLTQGLPDNTLLGTLTNAILVIKDDDTSSGVFGFSTAAYSVTENGVSAVLTINRTNGFTGQVSVDFTTLDGTALDGKDYTTNRLTVVLADGQVSTNLNVAIIDNTTQEGNRDFSALLRKPTRRFVGAGSDDDFEITVIDPDAATGNPVQVVFTGGAVTNAAYDSGLKTLTLTTNSAGGTRVTDLVSAINSMPTGEFIANNVEGPLTGADVIGTLADADLPALGIANASVTILDNEPSAGSVDTSLNSGTGANGMIHTVYFVPSTGRLLLGGDFTAFNGTSVTNVARLNANGTLDLSFNPGVITLNGTNGTVRAVGLHTSGAESGRIVIAGLFNSVRGTARNNIARLNADGSLDTAFNPGLGANNIINAVSVRPDGHILIGGAFTSFDGVGRNFIARLNADGSLDTAFDPNTGANGQVRAIALDNNGRVLIGGDFTLVDGVGFSRIARLFSTGPVDRTFDPGTGANGFVGSIAVRPDGRILIGGSFTSVNGVPRLRMAQLNEDGTLDSDAQFSSSLALDDFVNGIALQPDGKAVVVGAFTSVNGVSLNRVARLNSDGTPDASLNIGTGANDFVSSVTLQTDGKIVLAGRFTNFNNTVQNRIVRLHGGDNLGVGRFNFRAPTLTVNEDAVNAVIEIVRSGGLSNAVSVVFSTSDGSATSGVDYGGVTNTLVFAGGQTSTNISITISNNTLIDGDRTVNLALSNPDSIPAGGLIVPRLGTPSTATLTILDDDGVVGFSSASYSVSENTPTATITVARAGGKTGPLTVDFATIAGGTATAGADYTPAAGTLSFAAGQASTTFTVPILNDAISEGNETVFLELSNVAGSAMLGQASAVLTIIDDEFGPGVIGFSTNLFGVDETNAAIGITVVRTGGSLGPVGVGFSTSDLSPAAGAATAGLDYAATNGVLSFADGETSKSLMVQLLPDDLPEGNETFTVILTNATGGATLDATTTATVMIVDDDSQLEFSAGSYAVVESSGVATISVVRTGGTNSTVALDIGTQDFPPSFGFAVAGQDYVSTNATLVWTNGDITSKSLDVVITDDLEIEGPEDLQIVLSNLRVMEPADPTVSAVNSNGLTAVLTILEDDFPGGSVDNTFTTGTIPGTGPNTNVNAVLIQPDGKILLGGAFTRFDTTNVANRVARLNTDGSLDSAFTPGLGANNAVNAIALDNNTDPLYAANVGKIVLGGFFTTFNANVAGRVTRLNADGSLDTTFSAGVGADNAVYAVAVQADGKVLIGGAFTSVGGTNRNYLARLNQDGSLDTAFLGTDTGADDVVRGIAVAADGKILVAGHFTVFNGVTRRGVARLNTDGSLDTFFLDPAFLGVSAASTGATGGPVLAVAFQVITNGGLPYVTNIVVGGQFAAFNGQPLAGLALLNYSGGNASGWQNPAVDGYVGALATQPDGKILLGGGFTMVAGLERNRMARLATNGVIDTTINFGVGFNSPVAGIAVQANGRLVVGGAFTEYDNTPKNYLARLHGGLNAGSGLVEFSSGSYSVSEAEGVATLTVVRYGGLQGAVSVDHALSTTDPGNAIPGTDYTYNPGSLVLSEGQYRATFTVGLIDNFVTNATKVVNFDLVSTAPPNLLGGVTTAVLNILDDESVLDFELASYSVNESAGGATITVKRSGSGVGTVSVDYFTQDGSAVAGIDYLSAAGTLTWASGDLTNKTFTVGILDNFVVNANKTVLLSLTNASPTNAFIGRTNATLTILDNEFGPGFLAFSGANFDVNEGDGGVQALITVVRTNGNQGPVSVTYVTRDGTATNGLHYTGVSGALNWADGDVAPKSFTVPILLDTNVNPARVVNLALTNAAGGATLGTPSTATLTILDNDTGLQFSAPVYSVQEDVTNIVINVVRADALAGTVTVDYSASDGSATAPADYTNVSGTLSFGPGVTSQSFVVPVVKDDQVETNETVILSLANATGGAKVSASLGTAILNIIDVRSGSVDLTFDPSVGANGTVLSMAAQVDGSAVVGGRFTLINGTSRNRIARLNADGTLDLSFNPGAGANDTVRVLALQSDSKVLVGGDFTAVGALTNLNRIARIGTNGVVDATFDPGAGANAPVHAFALQPDGSIVVGGEFSAINGVVLMRIARLLENGVVDPTFSPGLGANGTVRAVAVQSDGKLIIGGDFSQVGGNNRNFIARLNADGSPDITFNPGTGPNAAVRAIVLQSDGKILLGGDFTSVSGIGRNSIARLNSDGSVDGTFDPGTGADGPVTSLYLNKDGKPVIGGAFTTVSSVSRNRIARLNSNGSLDITFDSGAGANDVVYTVAIPPVPPTTTTNINLASSGGQAEERFVVDAGSTSGTFTIDYEFFSVPDTLTIYYPPKAQGGTAIFTTGLTNGSATVNVPFGPGTSTQVELVMNEGSGQFGTLWFMSVSLTAGAAAQPESVLIGGDFTLVDGVSQNRFARLNEDGSVDTGYNSGAGANNTVNTIVLDPSGQMVVAGDFTLFNGVALNRVARLNPDGSIESSFNPGSGASGSVQAVALQSDGKAIIGGLFTNYSGLAINRIARLGTNGALDLTFNPGAGANNSVLAVALQGDKVLAGGGFTAINGVGQSFISRLNADGALDPSFNAGAGANNAVRSLVVYTNGTDAGKILIAGYFTSFNGTNRTYVARLNADGALDLSFGNAFIDGPVLAAALQTVPGVFTNKVVVGGLFASVNGASRNRIARLNQDGTLDPAFDPGSGADDLVNAVAVQDDGRVLIGGGFSLFNGISRSHITRLTADGALDPTMNLGTGANGFVSSVAIQSADGKVMIGGGFTMVDGVLRNRIARLYGGQNSGNGILEFSSTSFTSSEVPGGRTETVTVVRRGGLTGQVEVGYKTADGTSTNAALNAVKGDDYDAAGGLLTFEEGENRKMFTVTVLDDTVVEQSETLNLALTNVATLTGLVGGGAILGNNNAATLTIFDNDSVVGFALASYSVNESGSNAVITVSRTGGLVGSVAVNYSTSDGTAVTGADYTGASGTLIFGPGVTSRSFLVPILDDALPELNETVLLALSNPLGAITLTNSTATLTIVDDELAPGELRLMTNSVSVAEAAGSVTFTVVRTNGIRGVVTANYATSDSSAQAGADYINTSGTLTFADGETVKTFTIPIISDSLGEGDETFNVTLSNPTGGATVGAPGAATVTIRDDDVSVSFEFADYSSVENQVNGVISLIRTGGTNSSVSVAYATTLAGTATSSDFVSVSGSVAFAPGETNKSFTVPILDDAMVEPDETVGLVISNPTSGATLGTITSATLTIRDNDANIQFTAANYNVSEYATNAVINVIRVGLTNATTSVTYSTSSGSGLAGLDYTNTTGTLTFVPGETNKTFLVGIVNDLMVETNETLNLMLSSPTGGAALGIPSAATLTIVDNDVSLSFVTNAFRVLENSVGGANITVIRQGVANVQVSVSFATSNGTAVASLDYEATSGVLTFLPGETTKTFAVTVTDDGVVEGDETVNLVLSNQSVLGSTNGVTLVNPSSAVLTIVDDGSSFAFSTNAYSVSEGDGTVTVTVVRGGITTGAASVTLSTLDSLAVSGSDYVGANVVLNFAASQTSTNVPITILNDTLMETNKTFTVRLSDTSGEAVVVSPANATVTIVDNDSTLQFLSATNSVTESANLVLSVVRLGATNTQVQVDFATGGGTAAAGAHYVATNGTLTFDPGITNQTITVGIIDDQVVNPGETFNVTLSNPQGEAGLGSPASTVVTIMDNDVLRLTGAGFTLVSESFVPASGGIDPGETVTVSFAITNIGNVNVSNVTATLLSTNGVTTNSPQTQSYGTIALNSVVARPFTFKATSSNLLTATLQLTAGTNALPAVTYTIQTGVSRSFTNAGFIAVPATINVPSVGPAEPYPSAIEVSNLVGAVNKVTVTLNQLVHSYPEDIDILLVGPAGQKMVLMSDAGGNNPIPTNSPVILTFDDAAPTAVLDGGQIVSGTYYPTNYGNGDSFAAPAPAGPYAMTNLSVFNGTNPNGSWQLYVVDDVSEDVGVIFSGWSLTITTSATTNPLVTLGMTVVDSPDPVFVTDLLSYTVTITNGGPNTATNVVFTNTLPAGVVFVSVNPSQGAAATNTDGLVVGSLGNLAAGGAATINLVVNTTVAGSLTNLASAGADGTEVITTAEVTTVQGLAFSTGSSGVTANGDFSLMLVGRANRVYVIEVSTNLLDWTAIFTNGTPDGAVSFIDTNAPLYPHQFYRAREQ